MASHSKWMVRLIAAAVTILPVIILTYYYSLRMDFHLPDTALGFHPVQLDDNPAIMSARQIFDYLHRTNSHSCRFSVDFGFAVYDDGQIAAPDGHKAVCMDDGVAPVFGHCLIYSFGINHQWSFDRAMEEFKCQVYAFDPSMVLDSRDPVGKRIHFFRLGLDGQDRVHPTQKWPMKTVTSIYDMLASRHGNRTVDVLKMDVEFKEWEAIPQMLQSGFIVNCVKQLAVEIHFLANDTLDTFRHRLSILKRLETDGQFVRFSSRPNPWLKRSISILNNETDYIGFELAWYNSRFKLSK